MVRRAFLVCFGLLAAPLATTGLHAQAHAIAWVWSTHCHNPSSIALSLRLDGRILYRGSIPICRWEKRFMNGRLHFRFSPPRPLVWYGYRSDAEDSTQGPGDTTAANTSFEVEMWEAGGETDAVLLGFAAVAKDGIHMNAIHFLYPDKASSTTMAPGLVLETRPETRRAGPAPPAGF